MHKEKNLERGQDCYLNGAVAGDIPQKADFQFTKS